MRSRCHRSLSAVCASFADYLPPRHFSQLRICADSGAGEETGQQAAICGRGPLHALPGAVAWSVRLNNLASESPISSVASAPDAIALGLGLTNECNLSCAFCYRDPARTDRLTLEQVKSVMERLPVRSVNLGTGENGMHPDFRAILAYLRTQPVKLTITSNGHSIAVLEDSELRAFHDIEFSLDYPTQAEQDMQRGLRELGAHPRTGSALCEAGRARNHHCGNDEGRIICVWRR